MRSHPLWTVPIGDAVYFAARFTVKSNAYMSNFLSGNYTQAQVCDLLKVDTGAGITFEADALCVDASGKEFGK